MPRLYPELAELRLTLLNDGEEEVKNVIFVFPNEKKLRCSSILLSKVSHVFEKMFSDDWQSAANNVVKMDDLVIGYDDFDQYTVFKLFLAIIYDLCDVDSLDFSQAMKVYYYSHKYQVDILCAAILSHIGQETVTKELSPIELKDAICFVELFELSDLTDELETTKLNLTEKNCHEFYEITTKNGFSKLQQQVISYCSEDIKPNPKWTAEFLCKIIENLQYRQKWRPEQAEYNAIPKAPSLLDLILPLTSASTPRSHRRRPSYGIDAN